MRQAYDDLLYHIEFGNKISNENVEKIKECLKLHIPKEVKVWSCKETRYSPSEFEVNCPSCDMRLDIVDEYVEFDYCPYCGQKLDWGEDEK